MADAAAPDMEALRIDLDGSPVLIAWCFAVNGFIVPHKVIEGTSFFKITAFSKRNAAMRWAYAAMQPDTKTIANACAKLKATNVIERIRTAISDDRGRPTRRLRRVDVNGEAYVEKVIEVDGRPLKVINGTQPLYFETSMENLEWFLKSLKPDVIFEQHSKEQNRKLDTAAAHDQLDVSSDATGSSNDDEDETVFVRKELEILNDKSKLTTGVFFTPSKRSFAVKKDKGADCKRFLLL
jgi:hypothetical protein